MKLKTFLVIIISLSMALWTTGIVFSVVIEEDHIKEVFYVHRTVASIDKIDSPIDTARLAREYPILNRTTLESFDSPDSFTWVPNEYDFWDNYKAWADEKQIPLFSDKYQIYFWPHSSEIIWFLMRDNGYGGVDLGLSFPASFWPSIKQIDEEKFGSDFSLTFFFEKNSDVLKEEVIPIKIGPIIVNLQYKLERLYSSLSFKASVAMFGILLFASATVLLLSLGLRKLFVYLKMKLNRIPKRTILITSGVFVFFFILTNPSLKDFKEHGHTNDAMRKYNFLLFSIYQEHESYRSHARMYLGISKNFVRLN